MSQLIRNLAVASTAGLLIAGNAFGGASPQGTTFQVSAQVIKSCNVSATALAFGAYDQLNATAATGTSTVTLLCTTGTLAATALNGGVNGSLATTRKMKDSVSLNTLNYNLYTTVGNTAVWGDGVTGGTVTQSYTSTGNAVPQVWTVYGTIPALQTATTSAAATYTDSITVSVTF